MQALVELLLKLLQLGSHTLADRRSSHGPAAFGSRSLQLRVLRLGFLQNGDVGFGVFPEREKVFVGGERPDAGGIGIRALRGSRLKSMGPSHAQMRQRSRPAVPD